MANEYKLPLTGEEIAERLNKIPDLLGKDELPTAVDAALAKAKESGEFDGADGRDGKDGKDGYTPVKGVDYFDGKDGTDGQDGYTPVKGVDYFDGQDGKNGVDGKDGYTPQKNVDYFDGKDGKPGTDGVSPVVSVSAITGGHRITITDKNGTKTVDVMDGSDGQDGSDGKDGKDGTSATHSWNGTVLTINSASGSSSADLKGQPGKDGVDGYTPQKDVDYFDGKDGTDGKDGSDGVSPTVTISKSGKVTTVSITDKNGTKTATINDGADGKTPVKGADYVDGKDGTSVTVKSVSESTADGGSNVVTFSDGKSVTIKNGSKGGDGSPGTSITVSNISESTASGGTNIVTFSDGKKVNIKNGINGTDGKDGKTPICGTDYWTDADKASMIQDVINALGGTPIFGIVDADKNIILTGELSNGIYTFKYENADGTVTEIGKLDTTPAPTYKNWIPDSRGIDGAIYNGKGYQEDTRWSLSGGGDVSAPGVTVSGYIPVKTGDVIRIKNIRMNKNDSGNVCVICYFWSRTAADGASSNAADITKYFNGVFDADGNLTQFEITADTHPTYIRLNTAYIGPDSILTINEPIE